MVKPARHTPQLVDEYVAKGYWRPEVYTDFWDRNATLYPDKEALVDSRTRLTWQQAKQQIDRVALSFLDLGIKKDDVIAFQLYNCVEVFTVRLACQKMGAIPATMMPTFREAEVEAILDRIKARGIVIPLVYRNFDYVKMIQGIRSRLPSLEYVMVVGDDVPQGTISISHMIEQRLDEKYSQGYLDRAKSGPTEIGMIMTTSGTTGMPKCSEFPIAARLLSGRVHMNRLQLTQNDVLVGLGPVVGGGGATLLFAAAPQAAAKIVLMEKFEAEEALALLEREKATGAAMVPAQLALTVTHPNLSRFDLSSLRFVQTGTALLPPSLALEAERKLSCRVTQNCGATDCGSTFATSVDDPVEVRVGTVGKPLNGAEVKLIDDTGREVAVGEVGQVMVRGPHCAGGLFNNPEVTQQIWGTGWARWDDLAKFDEHGNLIIVGRQRDTIIRGGQNIYPKEVEDILMQHPCVVQSAVVKMPDPVMGEKACAYVVTRPGMKFTYEQMVAFLKERKIAPFKLPERLEIVADMPLAGGQKTDKRSLEADIAQKLKAEGKT